MMSSYSDGEAAIMAALAAFAWPTADFPVGYQGQPFTPPTPDGTDAVMWAVVNLIPVSAAQNLQTLDKVRELLQIDIKGPMNHGTARLTALRDQLLTYFAPRRLFKRNGQGAKVRQRSATNVLIFGGWQQITITVTFGFVAARDFS